jgi:hypothetical protein
LRTGKGFEIERNGGEGRGGERRGEERRAEERRAEEPAYALVDPVC